MWLWSVVAVAGLSAVVGFFTLWIARSSRDRAALNTVSARPAAERDEETVTGAAPAVEPALAERLGAALEQAMMRGAWEWMDGLTACPACAQSHSSSSLKDKLSRGRTPSSPPEGRPSLAQGSVAATARPAGSVADKSRQIGKLSMTAHGATHVHRVGAPHYVSYTFDVRCGACGMARSFLRADGSAHPAYALGRLGAPAGPRRRWSLALRQGSAIGAVIAGGDASSEVEAAVDPSASDRFTCLLARAVIDRALDGDLAPLPPVQQDALRVEAVRRALPSFGVQLVNLVSASA